MNVLPTRLRRHVYLPLRCNGALSNKLTFSVLFFWQAELRKAATALQATFDLAMLDKDAELYACETQLRRANADLQDALQSAAAATATATAATEQADALRSELAAVQRASQMYAAEAAVAARVPQLESNLQRTTQQTEALRARLSQMEPEYVRWSRKDNFCVLSAFSDLSMCILPIRVYC